MAHWHKSEITEQFLKDELEFLRDFSISITFSNMSHHSNCFFTIIIRKEKTSTHSCTINIGEQIGCCGYGNVFYPSMYYPQALFGQNAWDKYVQIVEACARRLCLSGIKYVGRASHNIVRPLIRNHWKVVHKVINPRYREDGASLIVLCKNLNPYKNGKPLFKRNPGKRSYM